MKYKLCNGVTIEYVDGHNVLITDRGDAAVFNETAEYIFHLLINNTDYDTLIQKVTETYNIDTDTAYKDIPKLVFELIDKSIIQFN